MNPKTDPGQADQQASWQVEVHQVHRELSLEGQSYLKAAVLA